MAGVAGSPPPEPLAADPTLFEVCKVVKGGPSPFEPAATTGCRVVDGRPYSSGTTAAGNFDRRTASFIMVRYEDSRHARSTRAVSESMRRRTMSFVVDGVDHVEVFVRDIDGAIRWYAKVLGLTVLHRWDPEPVMIGAGGSMLALFRAKPGATATTDPRLRRDVGWHRVAWRTTKAGFEAAQRHLTELRIRFRGPIDHDLAWSIYFDDPDGNRLEITYYLLNPV
jgi:catechol 2,3-dioxygenase-like lactoylglutathione lyase family enzyme